MFSIFCFLFPFKVNSKINCEMHLIKCLPFFCSLWISQVGLFVKACRESIEALKDSIGVEEKKNEKSGWLSALSKSALNKDLNAHQHGMV